MGIISTQGDILASEATIIVVPVNTMGAMGKGLALAAKQTWPLLDNDYRRWCRDSAPLPGAVLRWTRYAHHYDQRYVVCLATKAHWRNPSRLEWIDDGLARLAYNLPRWGVASIAVPALGCGLGELAWADVRPLIAQHLGGIAGLTVEVYAPRCGPAATAGGGWNGGQSDPR